MLDPYQTASAVENRLVPIVADREVISCKVCGLVQYRTRTGKCRRCERLLPVHVVLAPLESKPRPEVEVSRKSSKAAPAISWRGSGKTLNLQMVEGIGRRIQKFRELRGLTQNGLQATSRVSRSYLSRIEIGQMTPSLGTLEKISAALGISLNDFFVPLPNREELLEDPFIQELRPLVQDLAAEQRQYILKRLAAMSGDAAAAAQSVALPETNSIRINDPVSSAAFAAAGR